MTFDPDLVASAECLLAELRQRQMMLATAESCTGGLICGLLTEIAGSSDVVDRGFVTYSDEAKIDMLGVPAETLARVGAVSRETALAMASGALAHSRASIAVSVTGIAGPSGGSAEKPVGLVHFGLARKGGALVHREEWFGDIGRQKVRIGSVRVALRMIADALGIKLG